MIAEILKTFWLKPTRDHWFMFSFASKRFTRIYVYAGWLYLEASNNWAGQLDGMFMAGIYLHGFWKHGPRFMFHSKPK